MRFNVEMKGLEALERKLTDAGAMQPIRTLFKKAVDFGEARTREGAKPHPGDTGKLSHGKNIRSQLAPEGTALSALYGQVYTNSPIVTVVDQGRPAGGTMPPIRSMEVFGQRHGMDMSRRRSAAGKRVTPAFYLARSIQRKGTKGVHFFQKAAQAMEERMGGWIRDAANEIERRWGR